MAQRVGISGHFQEIQRQLYEEALQDDPQNNPQAIELKIGLAFCSGEKKEELLAKALDALLASPPKNGTTMKLFDKIMRGLLQ